MGGLTSFASQAFQVLGAVNTVMGAVNQFSNDSGKRDYKLREMQNQVNLQNAQAEAENRKQQYTLEAQVAEEERRNALRRAIAKQKAIYGASGIDSSSGSAQALLLGQIAESAQAQKDADALDAIKDAAVNLPVENQKRINTLQLTQLREKNKYDQYTAGYGLARTVTGMLND